MTSTSLPIQRATLSAVARALSSRGRGVLAADESIRTMSERLEGAGIAASEQARRDYRQLLLTATDLASTVSGVIWCDETFGQQLSDGRTFPDAARDLGILAGIKVDTGTVPHPSVDGALLTRGLDGLGDRLAEYAARGAAFAKWRAVIDVDHAHERALRDNADALADYAAECQAHGIVPIVEPEVLAAGSHDLVAAAVTARATLQAVFAALQERGADLSGIVLKPAFVTPGLDCQQVSPRTVATITYDVLRDCVPAEVPTIAFLSGGHRTDDVCAWLSEINAFEEAPWGLTFSFGRALVSDALVAWAGQPANVTRAQRVLLNHCAGASVAAA